MLIFYEQNYLIYSNPLPNTSIGPTPKIGFSTRKVQAIQYKREKRKKKKHLVAFDYRDLV